MPHSSPSMPTIDFEASIDAFLALGRKLQSDLPLTAEHALGQIARWYHDTRIEGAEISKDGDMLLLQWGDIRPLQLAEPTDLRDLGDDDLKFTKELFKYIDIVREVMPSGDAEDAEFDDEAVQMSITLCYGVTAGNEPGANQWIMTPSDIETGIPEFKANDFVKPLLAVPTKHVVVQVGYCG